jgi:hypothetical protein
MNNAAITQSDGSIVTGRVVGSGSIAVNGGELAARSIRQTRLAVGGTGSVRIANAPDASRLASLSVTGSGRLDLTDTAMVIDYTSPSPLAAIRILITSGYNGGAWDGEGIVTSSGPGYAIGFAEASDLPGVPPIFLPTDGTTVLLRGTRYGDANLDGVVNLNDFNLFAANFGTGDAWHEGDFNYDGVTNLNDFNLLAANFGLSAAGPDVTPQDWSALAAAAPEPCALAVAVACCGGATLRRRRC